MRRAIGWMLFTAMTSMPWIRMFGRSSDWTEQRFELKAFAGADLGHLCAIAICASNPPGEYRVAIDQFEVR